LKILIARITAKPIYELKTGFSLHAYLCAEHVQSRRNNGWTSRSRHRGLR
jgi:hypothetical protein